MSTLETCAEIANELLAAREKLRPTLLRAAHIGGVYSSIDNKLRRGADDVDQALANLIYEVGRVAEEHD